ncbi:MAG: anaerobic ribonucleoside-triphosphate reductase activating protein [Fibrobacterota bacterium]
MNSALYDGVVALIQNSFIDFPGTVSAVLFYDGCNLRCPYCHNASLALDEPAPVSDTPEEIDAFLRRWRTRLDGIAITGGEPTLHAHLPALTAYLRDELGYRVKIDTNGMNPDMLPRLSVDYIAMDVKTTPDKYVSLLGAPSDAGVRLNRSLEFLADFPGMSEVRITAAPGVLEPEDVDVVGTMVTGMDRVYIQRFDSRHTVYDPSFFRSRRNYTPQELDRFCAVIRGYVEHCDVR